MSASLVGSEMCIRDSGPAAGRSARRSRRTCGAPRPSSSSAARQTRNPVSYTHLTLPTICSV
eukprot:13994700-Alexandrium_andersonii.AAC.1